MSYNIFYASGFSLDSGHSITRGRGLTVVAGAPRANHSGAVVLLRKQSETSSRLSVEHMLRGPGLGSSFGYDVAVVDLNGDGWVTFLTAFALPQQMYNLVLLGNKSFCISHTSQKIKQSIFTRKRNICIVVLEKYLTSFDITLL